MFFEMIFEMLQGIWLLMGYMAERSSFPRPLSPEKEHECLEKMFKGDNDARDMLILHNMRLVVHVVKKFAGSRTEMNDLISIGSIGLIKGVNSYTRGRDTKLATYAARCIENEVLMHLRATKKLDSEISLTDPIGTDSEGNELTNIDVLGSDPDSVIDQVHRKIEIEKILSIAKSELTPRERVVFEMRYGLIDGKCYAQREVAKELGISRSYVSRIEKRAIEKIKEHCSE
jgi:RNA polymerase sporulation-specific sigma factor